MALKCPLCGAITLHADTLAVWAIATLAMLALTLEALMICAMVRLTAGPA